MAFQKLSTVPIGSNSNLKLIPSIATWGYPRSSRREAMPYPLIKHKGCRRNSCCSKTSATLSALQCGMSFWRCSELASPAVSPGSAGSPLEVIIWGVLNGDRDGTCSPLTKESVAPRPHASSNFAAEGSSSGRMKSGTRGRRLRLKIHCRVRTPLMM